MWDAGARAFLAHGIHVLALDGKRIREIIVFHSPEAFDRFGLPARVEPSPA